VQQARQVGAGPPAPDVCFRTAPAVKRVREVGADRMVAAARGYGGSRHAPSAVVRIVRHARERRTEQRVEHVIATTP